MGGSAEIRAHGETYFNYRIWSAPAALANYCVMGWFIGQSRAKLAFMVQLFLNLTNMALSAFFVLELGMTSDGVGLAALIAELSAVLLALALALGMLRRMGARFSMARILDRDRLWQDHGDERRHDDPHALPGLRLRLVHRARCEGRAT